MTPEGPHGGRRSIPVLSTLHVAPLDGLRALAILLVIPHNINLLTGTVPAAYHAVILLSHIGWIGVQLFFVLSGFLITGNLLDTRRAENYYSGFYGRRTLRIFPLYYAVLALAFIVAPLLFDLPAQFRDSLGNQVWLWTFLVNWVQPFGIAVYGFSHFWSLAVEEQFYLVWPFLIRRRSPAQVIFLCSAITIGIVLIRCLMLARGMPSISIYEFTICRMDALAVGAIAAALVRMPSAARWLAHASGRLYALGITLLIVTGVTTGRFSTDNAIGETIGYTLLSTAFALLLLAAFWSGPGAAPAPPRGVTAAIGRLLSGRLLGSVGRYSYAMYIFHLPLHVFIGVPLISRFFPVLTPFIATAYMLIATALCYLAAAASYHGFEKHFLRMKRAFAPRFAA